MHASANVERVNSRDQRQPATKKTGPSLLLLVQMSVRQPLFGLLCMKFGEKIRTHTLFRNRMKEGEKGEKNAAFLPIT